jgi:hypothetical protein
MKTIATSILRGGHVEDSLSEGGVYPVRALVAISVLMLLSVALAR